MPTPALPPTHDCLLESAQASLTHDEWLCETSYGGIEALVAIWAIPGEEATYSSPPEPPEAELAAAWLPRKTASGTILTPLPEDQTAVLEETIGLSGLLNLVEDQYPTEEDYDDL